MRYLIGFIYVASIIALVWSYRAGLDIVRIEKRIDALEQAVRGKR